MADQHSRVRVAAERDGTYSVGPGAGWDPVAAAEAATGEPAPLPGPAPEPPARCGTCGYLTASIGHQVACHG